MLCKWVCCEGNIPVIFPQRIINCNITLGEYYQSRSSLLQSSALLKESGLLAGFIQYNQPGRTDEKEPFQKQELDIKHKWKV